jgi:GNAT superfamily N-acetyltransferase
MQVPSSFTITEGFRHDHRAKALDLFWQAFKVKLNPVMKPKKKALTFLNMVADPTHSISADSSDGSSLLGIAGYKTKNGSFIGGDLDELQSVYGWVGGLWRGLFLASLERPLQAETLLMDGIMESQAARGLGIGTAVLSAVKAKAVQLHCKQVRLDVININPRARALYERQGFIAGNTSDIDPFRHVFGFRKSTTMINSV